MSDMDLANTEPRDVWLPVSDIMAGLMMLFMAIAVFFMLKVQNEKQEIEHAKMQMEEIAEVYQALRVSLYEDLRREFEQDLPRWGAEIDKETLVVRFREPDVLFDVGDASLKPRFREIINDFFPRYVAVITAPRYRDHIAEVRIEGHTSSQWNRAITGDPAYLRNMTLSQDRTRAVLQYALFRPDILSEKEWLKTKVTANGLSSSQLILDDDGNEDPERSQRVEFRVRTDSDVQMTRILHQAQISRMP